MALDKAALESLRLEREPDAGKYHERGGARRWLWIAVAGIVAIVVINGDASGKPVRRRDDADAIRSRPPVGCRRLREAQRPRRGLSQRRHGRPTVRS